MQKLIQWLFDLDPDELEASESWWFEFAADYGNGVILAMVAGLAVLGFLVVRSYRREGHAPVAIKATLTGLRLLVVAAAVSLLFRPAIVLRFVEKRFSTVAVVIDDSASMDETDRYVGSDLEGAPEESVALAEMLGVSPRELNELPRIEAVRRALLRHEGALARLAENQDVLLLRFAPGGPGGADYVEGLGVIPAAAREGDGEKVDLSALSGALAPLTAQGTTTDLAAAVRGALARSAGRRLSGMLIVSDGQPTVQDPAPGLAAARELAAGRRVPLCAVCVGRQRRHVRNVAVASIRTPARQVRRGDNLTFTVRVRHSLYEEMDTVVRLMRRAARGPEREEPGGWSEVAATDVTLPSGLEPDEPTPRESITEVEIELTGEQVGTEPGLFDFEARVDALSDEVNTEDNVKLTTLEVRDDKVNVLLIGNAGWEFQFLRNFFLRARREGPDGESQDVFRVSVWQQDADPGLNLDASRGMEIEGLPGELAGLIRTPDGSSGYDMVILYDPQPSEGFDKEFVDNLQAFVADHGGGLCYVAGRKYTETLLSDRDAYGALHDLLPVELGRNESARIEERIHSSRPRAYRVVLREDGMGHPVTRMGPEGEDANHVWAVLPGIYWSQAVFQAKPMARVLAVSSNPWHQTGKGEPEPVLALHQPGRGRVLYVGFDSTWRWRRVNDTTYFRRFWTNVARFLGPLEFSQLIVDTTRREYEAGDEVVVEATVYDEGFKPLTAKSYRLLLRRTDTEEPLEREIEMELVDPENSPGLYRLRLKNLDPGTYELAPAPAGEDAAASPPLTEVAPERVETSGFTVTRKRGEQLRPEANPATLRQLLGSAAERQYASLAEMDKLGPLLASEPLTLRPKKRYELLDAARPTAVVLGLLVVLLAGEWFVRKLYNMA